MTVLKPMPLLGRDCTDRLTVELAIVHFNERFDDRRLKLWQRQGRGLSGSRQG
jgi:hypothetical protein